MRGEIIKDGNDNYFTFLTYPVLQWNTQRSIFDSNLSPLNRFPYIVYDYNTLYVIPLAVVALVYVPHYNLAMRNSS